MRQLPGAYWTRDHGPVFAYGARDDSHAFCVSWRDEHVTVHHDDLVSGLGCLGSSGLPEGAADVLDLAEAVGDMMSPHLLDSGGAKPPLPRASDVGDAVLHLRLCWSAVHASGEEISQGWGRPPRRAA